MNNVYIEDNELFFKYLQQQCAKTLEKSYVLECALSVIESQSRLLVENNYRQFLVSRCFDKNNPYNVQGTKGVLYLKNYEVKINELKSLFEEHLYKTKTLLQIKKKQPKSCDFNVLLIQGLPNLTMGLYGARINKIFGDVINEDNIEYKRLYEAIYNLVCKSSTHEYELCHDKVSELGKELYLIKRR